MDQQHIRLGRCPRSPGNEPLKAAWADGSLNGLLAESPSATCMLVSCVWDRVSCCHQHTRFFAILFS